MKKVSRDLGAAAIAAGATLGAVAFAQSHNRVRLCSHVYEGSQLEKKMTKTGFRRDFFDGTTTSLDRLECHVSTINVGETAHVPHQHLDEELVIVQEGSLEVTINGTIQRAGPGSVIFYSSNDLHGMRNAGDAPATYYVIRFAAPGISKAAEKK
jgi:quercetin dioxygenase-like cupin family protein